MPKAGFSSFLSFLRGRRLRCHGLQIEWRKSWKYIYEISRPLHQRPSSGYTVSESDGAIQDTIPLKLNTIEYAPIACAKCVRFACDNPDWLARLGSKRGRPEDRPAPPNPESQPPPTSSTNHLQRRLSSTPLPASGWLQSLDTSLPPAPLSSTVRRSSFSDKVFCAYRDFKFNKRSRQIPTEATDPIRPKKTPHHNTTLRTNFAGLFKAPRHVCLRL